ncbi:hypothetical protein SAMN05428949_4052 [Chitinophaga sp. YR627]|uniref:hypothetical protein n=1 Tax=Chitinophaga sp. YR627 TaxID=1881041 RepID=UPI0008E7D8FC|nr:hypothetical protein [Chitinophaga sp. YR627]SFN98830.1 hypothetical protein SAMN05428949_4052 [Chitinophaga sp. YR627]
MMKRYKAIDEVPEKGDFVLEVQKDKPHWLLRYGNLLILIFLAAGICLFMYWKDRI